MKVSEETFGNLGKKSILKESLLTKVLCHSKVDFHVILKLFLAYIRYSLLVIQHAQDHVLQWVFSVDKI